MKNDTRTTAVMLFYNKLAGSIHFSGMDPAVVMNIAARIEYSILLRSVRETGTSLESFMTVADFTINYETLVTYIATNLDDKDNCPFLPRLASGELQPEQIIELEPKDIDDVPLRQYIDKLKKQDMVSIEIRTSEYYKCRKCKSKCVIQEVQKRSLDEASNTIISCPTCGHIESA